MSAGLFVVRDPYADRARLINETQALAHEKFMLQARLSTVVERLEEIKQEMLDIDRRTEAQG